MPYYDFLCENNHLQNIQMTFDEHATLLRDETQTKYVECNVKYGDVKNPSCDKKAYQTFGHVGFVGLQTAPP